MLNFQENLPANDLSAFDVFGLSGDFSQNEQIRQSSGEKFVVFILDEELFAISVLQVAEVSHLPKITPLPNTPEWLLGITNLRGEIISVINLQKLSNEKRPAFSDKSKLIVLRSLKDNALLAVAADKICEVAGFSGEEIDSYGEKTPSHIFGKTIYKSKCLYLIDAEVLFQFKV